MKRTLPVDEEVQARIAQDTEGLISWETRLRRYDPDIDVEEERQRLAEEAATEAGTMDKAFGGYAFRNTESAFAAADKRSLEQPDRGDD